MTTKRELVSSFLRVCRATAPVAVAETVAGGAPALQIRIRTSKSETRHGVAPPTLRVCRATAPVAVAETVAGGAPALQFYLLFANAFGIRSVSRLTDVRCIVWLGLLTRFLDHAAIKFSDFTVDSSVCAMSDSIVGLELHR